MHTIYRFSGGDLSELRHDYGDLVKREFYEGELETEMRADFSITAQKAMSAPISLLRMTSNSSISYRRNWQHIRADKSGVRVIWFVRRGTCQLVRSRGSISVSAGECAIIDSNVPFHARMQPDDESFDVVYAIVPAHLFMSHLAVAADLEEPLALDYANRESVVRLLDLLCDLGENIGARTAEPLAAAFLEALSDRVREVSDCLTPRERNANLRLADIKAHIMRNLTNPDLNYEDVAAQCGISSRYLYYLLKADNTTFARLVWSQRLEKAREWLSSPELANYAIREIAFMAGFKDAAHFSRIFKSTFGTPPKEFRIEALKKAKGAQAQAGEKILN